MHWEKERAEAGLTHTPSDRFARTTGTSEAIRRSALQTPRVSQEGR
ncbi:hypothetical protein RGQ21_71420 [Kitasatospora aureofaciens]|nr:hypothetical protein RGQ21_71420 [Kitasatospora aureofaciens]